MSDCSEVEDMLDEFALGLLSTDERAVVLAHLQGCPACRGLVEVLSEAADELLLAGPRSEPPRGFADGVLARMDSTRPHRTRRPFAAAAAAAVLILAGGIGVGLRLPRPDRDELRSVQLIATGGGDAGDVFAYQDRPAWVFLRVDGALPGGSYRCVLDLDDDRMISLGALSVTEGKGAWSWRATVDVRSVRAARLLDTAGRTVATASFR